MRFAKMAVLMSTIVGAAACSGDAKPAQPAQPQLTWLDSMMTAPAQPPVAATATELTQAPVALPAAAPVAETRVAEKKSTSSTHRSSSAHRSRSRSSSRGSSSGTYASSAPVYRQPRVTTVKHTRRDAAIGAGAGAVLGAVAGGRHHRVRGAVVGGVLGGVAGAVIGNNVDKGTRVDY